MRTDWPDGAEVAVSLTFDVDAESGWLGEGEAYAEPAQHAERGRATASSAACRGSSRSCGRADVRGTFYVPGDTAERHTAACREIVAAGHEIGHHGYLHLRSDAISPAAQREEIERGLEALERLGVTPRGYRSPSWELTPETFALLLAARLRVGQQPDGRRPPVPARRAARAAGALEPRRLAAPALAARPRRRVHRAGGCSWPRGWPSSSRRVRERRHVTYTMHPEVIGRGHRAALLERLIDAMRSNGPKVWFATHGDVAACVTG